MQQGSSSTATLTDEQIVGLEPIPARGTAGAATVAQGADAPQVRYTPREQDASDPEAFSDPFADAAPTTAENPQGPASSGQPELQPTASRADNGRSNATPESDPAWLRSLESQPQGGREAAAEARAWRAAASDVAALDGAYFSADPGTRAGLATRLYDSDPAAFRAMLAEGARMLSQRDPQALAELARQLGAPANAGPSLRNSAVAQVARRESNTSVNPEIARPEDFSRAAVHTAPGLPRENRNDLRQTDSGRPELQNPNGSPAFPADAYRSFEAATNDDVGRRVNQAIEHALSSALPEGTADGARRRIAADIFQEVHASLAADRARSARIESAASRREVSGGRLPEPVPAASLRPRNVDYRRLSDDEILDM